MSDRPNNVAPGHGRVARVFVSYKRNILHRVDGRPAGTMGRGRLKKERAGPGLLTDGWTDMMVHRALLPIRGCTGTVRNG